MKKRYLISLILVATLILALIPLASVKADYYDAYLDSTGTYYETAQQAINAAATYGGTVTIRTSIYDNVTIPGGSTININLNGYSLYGHIYINGNLNVRGDGNIVPYGKTNQPANTYDLSNCTINGTIRVNKNLTYTYADLNATAYLVLPYNGEVNFTSYNSSVVSTGRIVKNSENAEYLNTVIYNINGVGNTNTNIMTTDEKVNIAMNITVTPAQLSVKTANVANKVYDGNTNATINSLELQGFVRDEEYISGTDYTFVGSFVNANVGNNKTVNIDITLNNEVLSRNYTIGDYQTTANITNYMLTESNVSLTQLGYIYDGTAKTPTAVVTMGNTSLVKNTDYTVSYSNNVNAGTATVTITGIGNYSGTVNKTFVIGAKSLNANGITLARTEYTYSGNANEPGVVVKDGETTLVPNIDYTVSYSNNVNAGTATATVTGIGNYKDAINKTFIINKVQLTKPTISGTYTYNGSTQTVLLNNYNSNTMSVSNNTRKNAGTQTVTISIKDTANYEWTNGTIADLDLSWTINAKDLNADEVTLSNTVYTYNGLSNAPDVTVTDGTTTLIKYTDYTTSYYNIINAGTATVTVNGIGNYKGTVSKTFTINKAQLAVPTVNGTYTYNGSTQTVSLNNFDSNTMNVSNNTRKNSGTQTVTISLKDTANYEWSNGTTSNKDISWTINKKNISDLTVNLSQNAYVYNGTDQRESVTSVKFGNETLILNTDYTVSYPMSDYTNAGNKTIRITAVNSSNYTGTKDVNFVINKARLSSFLDDDTKIKADYSNTLITKLPIKLPFKNNDLVSSISNNEGILTVSDNRSDIVQIGSLYAYEIEFNITGAGQTTVVVNVEETQNYLSATKEVEAVITQAPIHFTATANNKVYDRSTLTTANEVTFLDLVRDESLEKGVDYDTEANFDTKTYGTDKDVNVKVILLNTVKAKNYVVSNADDIYTTKADITKLAISNENTTIEIQDYTYTRNEIVPECVVKVGDVVLVEGEDYTVSATNNINVGTAQVTITGIGSCEGTADGTFIINPKDIDSSTITIVPDLYTFDGENKNPTVTVKDGNAVLEEDSEYTIAIKNNKNAGKATVTVAGKGNYKGTKTAEFTIEQAELKIENTDITLEKTVYDYDGNSKEPSVTVKHGTKTLEKDVDYTVSYSNNVKSGKATVTVTGKGNYKGSQSKTFIINPKAVILLTTKNVKTNKVEINWEKDSDVDGYEIYMTTVNKDTKNMKTKSELILRKSTSTKSKALKTLPKGAKVKILKKNVKKSEGYTWYKVKYNGKTGYVASKFLKDVYVEGTYSRIKKVTSKDTLTYTKKKLTKNKQYAFKVRSYRIIDGITYYGTYSNVKKATISK